VDAPDEFRHLFAQEYRSVVCAVNVVMQDMARAEEVTQEAFVRLLEHWDKVSRYDRPGAWLRKVAIRLATRAARRESRVVPADVAWAGTTDDAPLDLDLMAAIRELPPKQRAVIALHYMEDRSVGEVAHLLGCAPATVSVHLHRARKRLAELLGEEAETHVG
jgi:RNA polymerase sigma-70 factor (ECF subfamily)